MNKIEKEHITKVKIESHSNNLESLSAKHSIVDIPEGRSQRTSRGLVFASSPSIRRSVYSDRTLIQDVVVYTLYFPSLLHGLGGHTFQMQI